MSQESESNESGYQVSCWYLLRLTQKNVLSSGLVSKPSNKLPGLEYTVDFLKATWNQTRKHHIKSWKNFISYCLITDPIKSTCSLTQFVHIPVFMLKKKVYLNFLSRLTTMYHCVCIVLMQKRKVKFSQFYLSKCDSTQTPVTWTSYLSRSLKNKRCIIQHVLYM